MKLTLLLAVLATACGGPLRQNCAAGEIAIPLHMASYCETPCATDADCSGDEPHCMAMENGPHFCAAESSITRD